MINPAAFIGEPLKFGKICNIYPPKIKDVSTLSYFGQAKKVLSTSQDELIYELKKQKIELKEGETYPTPFEFLLANCYYHAGFEQLVRKAFVLFTHSDIIISYEQKAIIIASEEELDDILKNDKTIPLLNDQNYFEFQNWIRMSCGEKALQPPEPEDPNEDPRIRRIKQKARERDAIKAMKGVSNANGINFETMLVAICCMGLGLTPLNIGEMSYAAVGELVKVYQNKEKYEIDVRSLLAGADSKKVKPKYWIKNSD